MSEFHLLEYEQQKLEYVTTYAAARTNAFKPTPLKMFSEPFDKHGYQDHIITHDLVTDIYQEFSDSTWQPESTEYCQTRMGTCVDSTDESAYYNVTNLILGMCLSLDNTFKLAVKVTIVSKDRTHTKVMKGGILSMLNEDNEIMSWVSQSIMSNSTGAGD